MRLPFHQPPVHFLSPPPPPPPPPRPPHLGDAGLLLENDLGVSGDPSREDGRQGQRLVEGVGVQGLGAAEHGRHRLHRRTDDVVVRVLCDVVGRGDVETRYEGKWKKWATMVNKVPPW